MLKRLVEHCLVYLSLPFFAASALAAPVIDQFNDQPGSIYQIDSHEVIAQEFRPAFEQLVHVDLWLSDLNNHIGPILPLTLNVRDGTIAGSILSTVSIVPAYPAGNTWIEFLLPAPISLIPGDLYVLELQASSARGGWMASSSVAGTDYADGVAYLGGVASVDKDFMFRTFAIVPEPATSTMFMIGLLGFGIVRRRGRRPTSGCTEA